MQSTLRRRRHKRRRPRQRLAVSPWTQPRIDYAKLRWSQGASALEIASELRHGISSDAVIGLIHRQRLAGDAAQLARRRPGGARVAIEARPRAPSELRLRPLFTYWWSRPTPWWPPASIVDAEPYVDDPGVDADIPLSQRRSLTELSEDTCRWPVGDPATSAFFFCGAPSLPDKPYCAAHCARAYRGDLGSGPSRARHRRSRARGQHHRAKQTTTRERS